MPGPVLLVTLDSVPYPLVEERWTRLQPRRIVVLAGPSVVADTVIDDLRAIAPTERVAGATRVETAAEVSRRAFPVSRSVVVASGGDSADALAAGPVAFVGSGPALLVEQDAIPRPPVRSSSG